MSVEVWALVGLVALGLAVGTFGTLIGAGGGFLLMPVLALLYPKERPELLASISLAVVCFNALSGTAGYARLGRVDYRSGTWFGAASIPGAVLGALVTSMIPRGTFDVILGSVLLLAAAFLLLRTGRLNGQPQNEHTDPRMNLAAGKLWLGIALSFGVGFLSSLLGIGGGIIHVPLLVSVLGFPVHVATATSHFVLAITSFAGTVTHILAGVFQQGVRRTIALAIGALIGAQIGARLSTRAPAILIMRALGVALGAVGVRIIYQGI